MFVKVIDMHTKGTSLETLDRATSSSTQMFTFLHKEVSSSCDQKSESSANWAKANIDEFSVPRFRREQMVNQLSSLLRDVKGVACRRTLFQKSTCSLLKLCSG